MEMNVLNLILLIMIFFMLLAFLFVRIFFTMKYISFDVPRINSGNDVISNQDLNEIVKHYRAVFELEQYEIIFKQTDNLYSLDRGLDKKNKEIVFSKYIFNSVGYELDYILGTLWFLSQRLVKKNSLVRFYNFANNYGFVINFFLFLILFLLTLIIYLVVGVSYHGEIDNRTLMFLWNFPVLQLISFFLFFNSFILYIVLSRVKENIENTFSKEVMANFEKYFKQYSFDLKAARRYAKELPLPHNFAFKTLNLTKEKWLGPFVKN